MLDRETFMLTSTRLSGCLKIYTISHDKRSPTLLANLHLPELLPEYYLRALDSHSGPVHAFPPENSFFTSVLEYRIQVISVSYVGPVPGDIRNYSVFIHNDKLIGAAKSSPPGSNLPWHSWGPQHTRFLPHCVPTNWLRYIFSFFIWLYLWPTQHCVPDMFMASESSARHQKRSKYSILQDQRILPHPELVKHFCDQILHLSPKNLCS